MIIIHEFSPESKVANIVGCWFYKLKDGVELNGFKTS